MVIIQDFLRKTSRPQKSYSNTFVSNGKQWHMKKIIQQILHHKITFPF